MVLDEDALEAMLQRGNHDEKRSLETVTTDQTEEYEVYERRDAEEAPDETDAPGTAPDASPGHDPAPRSGSPAPAPQPAGTPPFEAQGRSEGQAENPHFEEQSRRDEDAPGMFQPETPAAQERRRPQVWPPVTREDEAPPTPPSGQPTAEADDGAHATGQGMPPTGRHAPEMQEPPRPTRDEWPPTQAAGAQEHYAGAQTHGGHHDGPDGYDTTHDDAPGAHAPTEGDGPRTHSPGGHATPATAARGEGCRIAVVQALFNQEITDMMAELAIGHAKRRGAEVSHHVSVPGVYDLPLMTKRMAQQDDVDAVVVIGCVVKGETTHDELITHATAKTLQEVALATGTPIGFGVTGPGMTWEQAEARVANGKHAVEAVLVQWRAVQQR